MQVHHIGVGVHFVKLVYVIYQTRVNDHNHTLYAMDNMELRIASCSIWNYAWEVVLYAVNVSPQKYQLFLRLLIRFTRMQTCTR